MEREQEAEDRGGVTPAAPVEADANPPSRGPGRLLRLVGAVLAGVLLVAVALDVASSSSALCASCHEIAPRTDSWMQSAHTGVECVKCHQQPRAWYELPQRLYDRSALLGRDLLAHASGSYPDPVDARAAGSAPMSDAVCLQCHDPNRKATSGFRIQIDHAAHAKRNGSCVSCHIRTAHPVPTRGKALSLMAQCFTCHGTAKTAKAPGRCDLCHPSGYELKPASHRAAKWKLGHGTVAESDLRQCAMCHTKSTCDSCHGVEMPHPIWWVQGKQGHAAEAARDRAVCARCHGEQKDMCTKCHHSGYDPAKGTWVKQHTDVADRTGAAACFACHGPSDCVRCHTREE